MRSHLKTILSLSLVLLVCAVFFVGTDVLADATPLTYTPMAPIPGFNPGGSIPEFINAVYKLLIIVGSMFAVIKIAYAGTKYTMSDVVSSKQSALSDIKGVFLGLAILLLPFVVLQTINPDLIKLNILDRLNNSRISIESSRLTQEGLRAQESTGRKTCIVGNKIPQFIPDAGGAGVVCGVSALACSWGTPAAMAACCIVGGSVRYVYDKATDDEPVFTDEICVKFLEEFCDNEETEKIEMVADGKYRCTYVKKSETATEDCTVTEEHAAQNGKTKLALCTERCAGFGGEIQSDFSCDYIRHIDE